MYFCHSFETSESILIKMKKADFVHCKMTLIQSFDAKTAQSDTDRIQKDLFAYKGSPPVSRGRPAWESSSCSPDL